jgi:hypothetical protein
MKFVNRRDTMAGLLILLGLVVGILSIAPAVDSEDFLINVVVDPIGVQLSALFQFILFLTYMGFAILLFPILQKIDRDLALGFLSFRIIAGCILIFGIMVMLAILALGQELEPFGSGNVGVGQAVGQMLKVIRDQTNHVFMVFALGTGNLMLYWMLLRSDLLPDWLPLWGLFGTMLSISASGFLLFEYVEVITPEYLMMNAPTALLELVLGIWLLTKGFKVNKGGEGHVL